MKLFCLWLWRFLTGDDFSDEFPRSEILIFWCLWQCFLFWEIATLTVFWVCVLCGYPTSVQRKRDCCLHCVERIGHEAKEVKCGLCSLKVKWFVYGIFQMRSSSSQSSNWQVFSAGELTFVSSSKGVPAVKFQKTVNKVFAFDMRFWCISDGLLFFEDSGILAWSLRISSDSCLSEKLIGPRRLHSFRFFWKA